MKLIFLQNWFADEWLKALGWTLFHSLWIGLLAASVSGIIVIATKRSPARLRYNLLMGVLFFFLAACVTTFFIQYRSSAIAIVESRQTTIVATVSALQSTTAIVTAPKGFIDDFTAYFNSNADLFVFIWLIFFILHAIKLVTGLAAVQRLRHYGTQSPEENWVSRLDELSSQLGIRRSVTLLHSTLVKVPVALGFLKPVILVPIGLLSNLPPAQVEAILLHELAHIRRMDYFMNIIQRLAETVFFFNPSFTWICSLIRQEREACCDDMVVATTGQKVNYLEALVSFQEFSGVSTSYAMAIRTKQHYLLTRVKRLLTRENKKLGLMEKLVLLAGLFVFTAYNVLPQKDKEVGKVSKVGKVHTDVGHNLSDYNKNVTPPLRQKSEWRGEVKNLSVKKTIVAKPISTSVVTDTVPVNEKPAALKFVDINYNSKENDGVKMVNVRATSSDGKQYNYSKQNDKITSLEVEGRMIPENEIGTYSWIVDQIEKTRNLNKAERMQRIEDRKEVNEEKKANQAEKIQESKFNRIEKKESQFNYIKKPAPKEPKAPKGLFGKDKPSPPEKKSNLFAKKEPGELDKKLATKRKELDGMRDILEEKRKDAAEIRDDINKKKEEVDRKVNQFENELKKESHENDKEIQDMQKKFKTKQQEYQDMIRKMEVVFTNKIREIEDLKNDIGKKKDEIGAVKKQIDEQNQKDK